MSSIANTIKTFSFAVDIDGIPQLTVQKISGLGSVEIEVVSHGEGNSDVKTPGRTTYGDVTMENIIPTNSIGNKLWELLQRAITELAGDFKQTITVRMLAANTTDTLKTWVLEGAWVSKTSYNDLDRKASENLIKTAVWTVDKIIEL